MNCFAIILFLFSLLKYIRQQSNFNVTKMWATFSNFSIPIGEE
jgi:hypothetical protein